MIDFAKTPMGRKFFERDIPSFIKAIVNLTRAVDDNTESTERNTTAVKCEHGPTGTQNVLDEYEVLAKMQPTLDKMREQGITIDQEAMDKLRKEVLREEAVKILNHGMAPPGYKPLILDESAITSAPADSKRRALYLTLENWLQSDPQERAEVVEYLRNNGPMASQRAGTLLALYVQFADTLQDALKKTP